MQKIVIIIGIIIIIVALGAIFMMTRDSGESTYQYQPSTEYETNNTSQYVAQVVFEPVVDDENNQPSDNELFDSGEYAESGEISGDDNNIEIKSNNKLSDFDLSFLGIENKKENMIYSPLSIKIALKMLEEGSSGETKNQILELIGDCVPTKYESNEKMSLANGLFVKESFKDDVKESYIELLKSKFDADVTFDKFESAKNINKWIEGKTLKIIPEILSDEDVSSLKFALVNALAIDMEWDEYFTHNWPDNVVSYPHEKAKDNSEIYDSIADLSVYYEYTPVNGKFKDIKKDISTLNIKTSVNNYDVVNEIGEEKIKELVKIEFDKCKAGKKLGANAVVGWIEGEFDEFWERYIQELKENYHKFGSSTDYSFYVDSDVKVFAKDLEENDGVTLQYVGIMPINADLENYVKGLTSNQINEYINNLVGVTDYKDFKEGVVTVIEGKIPKFKFEYNLDLLNDLKALNITDAFDETLANLEGITDVEGMFISDAKHKANIEFTQYGIKAAAATIVGGGGGGDPFDYFFDVPVERIDLTFDKPYLFLIRDKENEDVWFVGTVYEPLLFEADDTTSSEV